MELTKLIKNLGADVVYKDIEMLKRIEQEMYRNPELTKAIENGEHELSDLYYKLREMYKDVDLEDIRSVKTVKKLEREIVFADSELRDELKGAYLKELKQNLREHGAIERDMDKLEDHIKEYADKLVEFKYGVKEDPELHGRITDLFKKLEEIAPRFEPKDVVDRGDESLTQDHDRVSIGLPTLSSINLIVERGEYYVETFITDMKNAFENAKQDMENLDPNIDDPSRLPADERELVSKMENTEKLIEDAQKVLTDKAERSPDIVMNLGDSLDLMKAEFERIKKEKERERKLAERQKAEEQQIAKGKKKAIAEEINLDDDDPYSERTR